MFLLFVDCIFCKIVNRQVQAKILSETDSSMSFLDAFPLSKGHSLVIPKNHRQKIQDLLPDEVTDLFSMVHHVTSKVDHLTGATLVAIHNGKNAGQEVPHLHVHIVPRIPSDSAGPIHSMFDSTATLSNDQMSEICEKLKD